MRRALILAPLALVLSLAACGDDDDDEPTGTATASTKPESTTTEPSETSTDSTEVDETEPSSSGPDFSLPVSVPDVDEVIGQVFPGLDDDQISCLAENLGADFDPSEALNLIEECNIELSDLQPGG